MSPVGKWLAWAWLVTAVALVTIPTAMTLRTYYLTHRWPAMITWSMARYIQAVGRPEDAILLNAPGQREVFEYYYDGDLPIYALPEQRPPDARCDHRSSPGNRGQPSAPLQPVLGGGQSDPDRLVEGWLDTHAYKAA